MKKDINFRLIELTDYQFLLSKNYDDDEKNPYLLVMEFFISEVRIKLTLGFFSEEHRDENFRDFTNEQAQETIDNASESFK